MFFGLERCIQDVRYAQRMLRKNRAITLVALLSLALGIGGNAAMFSIVNAILLRPLQFREPDQLLRVTGSYPQGGLVDMQQRSRTMDLAGYSTGSQFNLTGQGEAVRLVGSSVSANLFEVLGAQPEMGRTFRRGEDRPGIDRFVILSHRLWEEKFGGYPGVIGRVAAIDGVNREIVGVMPPRFTFPSSETQLWVPLHLDPREQTPYWESGYMPLIARLRPDATFELARSELRSLINHVFTQFPWQMPRDWNADATVIPLQKDIVGDIRVKLLVLLCAVGFVLLIACANVASLLLSLSASRRKEMALRASIGASRGRIVQQLLTESVVLALAGGALGVALAFSALSILKSALPADTPRLVEVGLDWRVLVFAGVLAIVTGIVFGLVPALTTSKQDLAGSIKAGGQRSRTLGGVRLRNSLTSGEVALAVVLLIGAGLLIKSLWLLTQVDPGFRREHLLTLHISPNESLCRERTACIEFYEDLVRRVQSIDGVLGAATTSAVPMGSEMPALPADPISMTPSDKLSPMLWAGAVSPDYFKVMGIPLLQGRLFNDGDSEKSAKVVIVNRATARRYWPNQDAIGQHIRVVWEREGRTVVGVVGDVRQFDLANRTQSWVGGAMYMPYAQSVALNRKLPSTLSLVLRTVENPAGIAGKVRTEVASRNPNIPVSEVRTMDAIVEGSTLQSRSMMWLFACFAGAALVLAAIGTYGVISYSVSQRTYEMGVRAALGATRGKLFGMVLGQTLCLVGVGLIAGIAGSLALTRLLENFLFGVGTTDVATIATVVVVLLAMALLSGYVPARRASRVDPLVALRVE